MNRTDRARGQIRRYARAASRRARTYSRRAALTVRIGATRLDPRLRRRDVRRASPERFVRAAYQIMLRRDGDPAGVSNYVQHLARGTLNPDGVLDEMLTSMELRDNVAYQNRLRSLHLSRCDFVRMLPRAERILDLGGTDLDNQVGSLVAMGYPYPFQQVTIVDLPHGDRHELYRNSEQSYRVDTHLGPVEYRYHSMADLSAYADGAFDMVFSGESIEHITEAEARVMVHEVRRVLEPGGWFCLDTPNRRATEIELGDDFSNPDHKIEYTDGQLSALLENADFEIVGRYGLAYVGESIAKGTFDGQEQARNHGVFAAIEDCYLLAYICRAPTRT